jgi:hypothetical protein
MTAFTLSLALLLVAGPGEESTRRFLPETTDLSGRWLLTMPAGFEYDATIEPVDGRYRLRCRATNLSGQYDLQGHSLQVVSPTNDQMIGMAWELKNRNLLILTDHPQVVGSDYRNATLTRQKSADVRLGRRNPIDRDR